MPLGELSMSWGRRSQRAHAVILFHIFCGCVGGRKRGGEGRPIMDFSPWTLFRPPGDVKSATSPTIHFNSNSWQGCTSCVVQQGANITFQHILTSFCLYRISDQIICNEGLKVVGGDSTHRTFSLNS